MLYKIFTHKSVVDLGSFSPRDYTAIKSVHCLTPDTCRRSNEFLMATTLTGFDTACVVADPLIQPINSTMQSAPSPKVGGHVEHFRTHVSPNESSHSLCTQWIKAIGIGDMRTMAGGQSLSR